jgi:two-component system, NarL family, sensor histidine kinase UhpB
MRRPSLFAQILAVNSLLITVAILAATVVGQSRVDLSSPGQRGQSFVLVAAIVATVLGNAFILRRRLAPLERLISTMERVNLNEPGLRTPVERADSADVSRLGEAFNRMLGRVEEERRRAAHTVLRAQEAERARLARDLHDEVNQSLTAMLLRLEASAAQAPPDLREELRETKAVATRAMQELLGLARELRPAALDDLGLDAALRTQVEQFGRRTGITAQLTIAPGPHRLTGDQQLVVYRVVQESLTNVARHSGARHVWVDLRRHTYRTEVLIADDGRGFDASAAGSARLGLGLAGMHERALLASGRLAVRSRLGGGAAVELQVGGTT